jgi:hypothetical protein
VTLTAGTAVVPGQQGTLVTKFLNYAAKDQSAMAQVHGEPTVQNTATTTTNDAGIALNLTTALGAAFFQDDSYYRIQSRVCARGNGAEYFYWESIAVLLGGTTPVLLEEALLADMDGDGFDPTVPAVTVSTNDVILSITGVGSNPANWTIQCFISRIPIAAASA